MRVAFVSPRYGVTVLGGAESATRQLAERVASQRGWTTEVFTTCALDHNTWKDVLPEGDALINGVIVHRINSTKGRDPNFNDTSSQILGPAPATVSMSDAQRWIELQGPVTPDLVDAVRTSGADVAVFYPYLYYPTVHGIGKVPMPAVLHPAAHDEPPFHLRIFRATFKSADAFVYQTAAERNLVQEHHEIADRPQIFLGMGVNPPLEAQRHGNDILGIGGRPYIVSVGRIDALKGSRILIEFFRAYKRQHPGPLALVLVGLINEPVPQDPDIVATGPVSEQDKWDIVRDAKVSISASPFESFSLSVMESALARVPVIVNGRCAATSEFAVRSNGGLTFSSYPEFAVGLQRLLQDEQAAHAFGEAGADYVSRHYSWPAIIDRYADFLQEVAGRRRIMTPFADVG